MRKLFLGLITIAIGLIFIIRLLFLQVINNNTTDFLNDNAIRKVFEYPRRGYVYDRNGKLLVANQPSYDIMIIPREVEPLDTLEFCDLIKCQRRF